MEFLEEKRIAFKEAIRVFSGSPVVEQYLDEENKSNVDILTCKGVPYEGINSYATMGTLSVKPKLKSNGKDLVVELVGACNDNFEHFPNIIATVAFEILNSSHDYYPGALFTNIVKMYYPNSEMKHILVSSPFIWDEQFQTIKMSKKYVAWLQLIPISEGELSFALDNGSDKLEDLFVQEQINVFDLCRSSVI